MLIPGSMDIHFNADFWLMIGCFATVIVWLVATSRDEPSAPAPEVTPEKPITIVLYGEPGLGAVGKPSSDYVYHDPSSGIIW